MRLTKANLEELCASGELSKGINLYHNGKVGEKTERDTDLGELHTCQVEDGRTVPKVQFLITENDGTIAFCTLHGRMAKKGTMCRHAAAALMDYLESSATVNITLSSRSDVYAREMLQQFLNMRTEQNLDYYGKVKVIPRVESISSSGDYPSFVLTIGVDHMYVIRNIREFVSHILDHSTFSYGKNLTLVHSLSMFDPPSRALVDIIVDQFKTFGTTRPSDYESYMDDMGEHISSKGSLILKGSSFDRWFDLLKDTPVQVKGTQATVLFQEGDPKITVSLVPSGEKGGEKGGEKESRVTISFQTPANLHFFGNMNHLYCWDGTGFLRCSPEFQSKVYPLLQILPDSKSVSLPDSDMASFVPVVLSPLEQLVSFRDEEGLQQRYEPDECIPRFYFDLEDGEVLVLRVAFRYGDTEISRDSPARETRGIRRDINVEQNCLQLAQRYLSPDGRAFSLTGMDSIFDFVADGLDQFREMGEVMISDRLNHMQMRPSRASVGISLSDGGLLLNIDTGEFPAEELEDLYQTLLLKRRYYRLKDGRILRLEGGAVETLAEMAHMMRITPKEMESGQVKLPAFRALYLDSLFSNVEQLNVTRNRQFRAMIRNFKSVAESDYSVSDELDRKMRPYQKIGFQWLKTLESCGFGGILADEMGLGKTVEAIAYLTTATHQITGLPSLIVCPASLILNWMDEFGRFGPELKVQAIMGNAQERRRLIDSSGDMDVWVTSYELLRQDVEQYAGLTFYCCILDEGQHVKNQTTQVSKAVKRVDCRQRFILTGTPIENRLSELWNLFDFLMPGYLFSHSVFLNKLEKPVVKAQDPEAMEQLRRMVQPFMLRRLKKDVLKELPDLVENTRRVPLCEEARKVYLATAQQTLSSFSESDSKLKVLAALTRLRQICCDPHLCFENYEGRSDKLEACLDLCSGMVENGHQILLFSQFTSMLDRIRERLDGMGISNFTLQGSTTKEMRAQLVRRFNEGEASVFLISLKAGGTGLNLTAADVVIHYDPWWNIAAQDQATGRAHRIGQQEHVQVYRLIAQDTIEEKILTLQEKKAGLMDALTDGTEQSILSMSKEDLLALLE